MDANGYPTKAELKKIRQWPVSTTDDCEQLLEWVRTTCWWSADWGWRMSRRRIRSSPNSGRLVRRYFISTGGWSGNEDIITALQGNLMFWVLCWYSSRRGGHYEFRV